MSNRVALVSFILTMLGATYQMLSYGLAYSVDRTTYYYYLSSTGFSGVTLTSLVLFWAGSHLIDKRGDRGTAWPSIILAVGVAYLGNLLFQWILPNPPPIPLLNGIVSTGVFLVLLPGPLILILAGLLGLAGIRRLPRDTPPQR